MYWTNLKLVFRNFWRDRTTSSINILGFAFSISIGFVIAVYVLHEFSYDKFHENYENIYRIVNSETNEAHVDNTIKEDILSGLPEVKDYCHLLVFNQSAPVQYKEEVVEIDYVASADNSFFNVFSFPFLFGNEDTPFDNNPNSILLSESTSRRLFGNNNPIGEKVTVFNEKEYSVSGVFYDFPKRSSIYADIIRNETNEVSKHSMVSCNGGKCEYKRNVFVTLNNQINTDEIKKKINSQLATMDKFLKKVRFQPFSKIHLYDNTHNSYLNKGNLKLLKILSGIALITLLLACINYINLTIAQYKKRIKEVGVRKTIGASKIELIKSFLRESMAVTFISILLAIFLSNFFLPLFGSFFNLQINLPELIKPSHLIIFPTIVLILGFINGFFPAIIITSFNPVNLFQKKFVKVGSNNSLKNILTTFQFVVSITLIFCVIIIMKQLTFIKHKDLGFKDSYLLKINTNHITKYDVLRDELLQNPLIINACYSSGIPGEINWGMGAGIDAKDYKGTVSVIGSNENFVETMGLILLGGRNLLSSEKEKACLINESALKSFEWKNWEGKYFNKWDGFEGLQVVGLVKDFHFGTMHEKIEPIVITYQDYQKSFLSIRISGQNIPESLKYIKNIWNNIEPNVPINYTFYDTWFDSMYKKEEQLAKMVSTFAILAIIISCLGIFGQAILSTANRIKEIGIRKVNGAKSKEIVGLVNNLFIRWIIVSMLCAIPAGFIVMTKWLDNFAYKTEISWWVFGLAGSTALIIALLTVSWQSWKAARRNPVEALRYE